MRTTTNLTKKQSLKTQYSAAQPTTISGKPLLPKATPPALPPDAREQLFNEGAVGPIDHVQVSTERIAKLNGILFDLDPQNLREGPLLPAMCQDPEQFFEQCVQRWLGNHPLLQHLEVRVSGTGLHGILWLDPAVEFAEEADRKRWCSIVKIVQAILLTDPLAPGVTATARAVGSVNSKNGQEVRRLKEGQPVSRKDVIALSEEMCAAPFNTLFRILTGTDRISPCPFCDRETLVALHHAGVCYGCGKVSFERLCGELFQPTKGVKV
jgi:hypothetical protein